MLSPGRGPPALTRLGGRGCRGARGLRARAAPVSSPLTCGLGKPASAPGLSDKTGIVFGLRWSPSEAAPCPALSAASGKLPEGVACALAALPIVSSVGTQQLDQPRPQ